jgi:hypothetical protein
MMEVHIAEIYRLFNESRTIKVFPNREKYICSPTGIILYPDSSPVICFQTADKMMCKYLVNFENDGKTHSKNISTTK